MYTRCLFCAGELGSNEAVEAFPVGRRLAYDARHGRLWVVCPRCERWNLTPLDARWEAIEEAERLYRDTPLRAATGQIGLARLRDGTELVRVGRPLRPELAAWRYGDQFGRRRRRTVIGAVGGVSVLAAGVGAAAFVGAPMGLLGGVAGALAWVPSVLAAQGTLQGLNQNVWVPDGTGHHLLVTGNDVASVRLAPGGPGGWQLKVPYKERRETISRRWRDLVNDFGTAEASLTGSAAVEVARRLLPRVNGRGASAGRVKEAVHTLESLGGEDRAFAAAAERVREWSARQTFGDTGSLLHLPVEARLALEMAAHEEQERRALEGELAALERAWQEAEAIAAIADDLLVPQGVRARLAGLRAAALRAGTHTPDADRDDKGAAGRVR